MKATESHLRIAFLIDTAGNGGAEQVVCSLAQQLNHQGHTVKLFTTRAGWLTEKFTTLAIPFQVVSSRAGTDPFLSVRLSLAIAAFAPNLVHSHLLDGNFYGALSAWTLNLPHLATEHGDVHHFTRRRFLLTKIKLIRLTGARFSAVSQFTSGALEELGIPANLIRIIYNPVAVDSSPLRTDRPELLEALGIKPTENSSQPYPWIWLHAANLRPVKNQRFLIEAFARSLHSSGKPQHLLIAGHGPELVALEKLAIRLDVASYITFLGHRSDVQSLLRIADGFLFSSDIEATPLAIIEAAAVGLPIVTTDVGGINEILGDNYPGLVKKGDLDSYATKMNDLIKAGRSNALDSRQLGATILAKYNIDRITKEYLQYYLFLLGRTPQFEPTVVK